MERCKAEGPMGVKCYRERDHAGNHQSSLGGRQWIGLREEDHAETTNEKK